jgi:predicted nuclease with RNAse H fold
MTIVGIDVGGRKKGFHGCALDGERIVGGPEKLGGVAAAVEWIAGFEPTTIAIDSPCEGAPEDARARPDETEFNKAGICRIRFTPAREKLAGNPYYEWIEHGLELYESLEATLPGAEAIETFPTAAWTIWSGPRGDRSRVAWSRDAFDALNLEGLTPRQRSQDDRDAVAAALVARQYEEGKTTGYGKIIVPVGRLP